jgi:hypothetical protein
MNEGELKPKRPAVDLETHRFAISPESMLMMKETREMFRGLQEAYPDFQALAFFGSRTLGREHRESERMVTHPILGPSYIKEMSSDLDIIFFIRRDMIPDGNSENRSDDIETRMSRFFDVLRSKGLPDHIHMNSLDVSKAQIEKDLEVFKEDARLLRVNRGAFDLSQGSAFGIAATFLLSVGDIYSTREAIIESFEKDINGEHFWRQLMKVLQEFERPLYKHDLSSNKFAAQNIPMYQYPQTLAEGRKYFLSAKQVETK